MVRTEGRFSGPSSAQPTLAWSVAGKGMCSGRSGRANLSFPAHFLCYFLLTIYQQLKNQIKTNQNNNTLLREVRGRTGKGENLCRRAELPKAQVGFSGLLFFGSFLLEEQKNRGAQLRDELGNAK